MLSALPSENATFNRAEGIEQLTGQVQLEIGVTWKMAQYGITSATSLTTSGSSLKRYAHLFLATNNTNLPISIPPNKK